MNSSHQKEATYNPIREIALECSISQESLRQLLRVFRERILHAKKGNNVAFMKDSILILREKTGRFHYSLQQQQVIKLVNALIKAWYIIPRLYPKTRKKVPVEGRKFLTEKKVFAIISENQNELLQMIREERGLDGWFRLFAATYNKEHPKEYFPMKWKSLSEKVKGKVKDLFDFWKGNIRAMDSGGLRFSSSEEIRSHLLFREFITYSVLEGRRIGTKNFRTIMRAALSYWYHHFYHKTWLRVPVTLHARKGVKGTLRVHMKAASPAPADILTSLSIDPRIWTDTPPPKISTVNISRILSSSVFTPWANLVQNKGHSH